MFNIYLTDSLTGEERKIKSLDNYTKVEQFNWEEGDYSCDCNRMLLFKKTGNEEIGDIFSYSCNDNEKNRFILRIEEI